MKRVLGVLLMCLLFTVAYSQKKESSDEVAHKKYLKWIEVCDLNEHQKKELSELLKVRQRLISDFNAAHRDDKKARKANAKKTNAEYQKMIKSLVGEENFNKKKEVDKAQLRMKLDDDLIFVVEPNDSIN